MGRMKVAFLSVGWFVAALFFAAGNGWAKDLSSGEHKKIIANVGQQFADAMNENDAEALIRLIDIDVMAKKVTHLVSDKFSASEKRQLIRGAKSGLTKNYVPNLLISISNQSGIATYRKVITVDGSQRALLLVDYETGGMSFLELLVDPKSGYVIDWYDFAQGAFVTHSYATSVSFLLPEKSNFFTRLVGLNKPKAEILTIFKNIGKLSRQGDYRGVFFELKKLPEEIYNHQAVFVLRVNYSQYVSEEEYTRQLSLMDKAFGDRPEYFFILLDHYFYAEKFQKAMAGLQRINQRFNNEPQVYMLMSNLRFTEERYDEAFVLAKKAIEYSNFSEQYYWHLSDLYLSAEQFDELVALFKKMVTLFNIEFDFDLFQNDPEFQAFANSKAFKQWLASQ